MIEGMAPCRMAPKKAPSSRYSTNSFESLPMSGSELRIRIIVNSKMPITKGAGM